MIPWGKFQSDESLIYSEHVHLPTPSTLSLVNQPHLHTPTHQVLLLNAPPLGCADSRRFVISQLPPAQRQSYLSAFHADHVCRVREAIEILETYIKKHEVVDLKEYDFKGRVVQNVDRNRGRGEGDERAGNGEFISDDDFSDATTDSERNQEVNYDFAHSLCCLSLDSENSIFGSTGTFEPPEDASELSLSLSSTPMLAPSIPSSPIAQASTIFTPFTLPGELSPLLPSRRPTPPTFAPLPPTRVTNTTPQSSLLPTTTATTYTTHATLSIANLIHHPVEPIIPMASLSSTDTSEEPDFIHLLSKIHSTTVIPLNKLYSQDVLPKLQSQQNPEPRLDQRQVSNPPTTTSDFASILRVAHALAKPPVPVRQIRTMKFPRMRRSSTERDRERGGSGDGEGEKQMSRRRSPSGSVPQIKGNEKRRKERETEMEQTHEQEQDHQHLQRSFVFPGTHKRMGDTMNLLDRQGRGAGDIHSHTHGWKGGTNPNLSTHFNTRVNVDCGDQAQVRLHGHFDNEYQIDKQSDFKTESQPQWPSNLSFPPSTFNAHTWSFHEIKAEPETGLGEEVTSAGPRRYPQYQQPPTSSPLSSSLKRKYRDIKDENDANDHEAANIEHPPSRRRIISPYTSTHRPTTTRGDFIRDQG